MNKSWNFLLIACITILLGFSLPGITANYSFWIDELYTVQFISGTWPDLLLKHVLPDTNPPLYFAVAKIWTSFAGLTEGPLRSLSLLFAFATLIYVWTECKREKSLSGAITLILISSNPYFLYYAQEARSYSALILLTSILFFESTKIISSKTDKASLQAPTLLVIASSIALSLTHYFGVIIAIITSIARACFKTQKPDMIREVMVMGVISVWPILHLGIYGYFNQSQIQRIALEEQPWWAPAQSFSISNLPYLNSGITDLDVILSGFIGVLLIIALIITRASKKTNTRERENIKRLMFAIFILGSGLILISLANQITPISTYRNFVIFIVPTSVAIGSCWEIIYKKIRTSEKLTRITGSAFIYILIGIQISLSLKISQLNIDEKAYYGPNYKLLAKAINEYGLCKNGCILINSKTTQNTELGPLNYYFNANQILSPVELSNHQVTADLPLIGYQLSNEDINKLRLLHKDKDLVKICARQKEKFENYSIILAPSEQDIYGTGVGLCPK